MDMRSVAARAVALAARGEIAAVIETLRALRAIPDNQIEMGDTTAHATIFPLPCGAVLPLHDHPAMTVVSKVLHGRMRVESFEWADRDASLARILGARDVDENAEPLVIAGTLHRITALTDCAFIDVFAPYYDEARPCRYYRIVEQRDGGVVLLEPTFAVPYRAGAHRS